MIDILSKEIIEDLADARIFAPYFMVESVQTIKEGNNVLRMAIKSSYGVVRRERKITGIDFRDSLFVSELIKEVARNVETLDRDAFIDVLKALDHMHGTLSRTNFYRSQETNVFGMNSNN